MLAKGTTPGIWHEEMVKSENDGLVDGEALTLRKGSSPVMRKGTKNSQKLPKRSSQVSKSATVRGTKAPTVASLNETFPDPYCLLCVPLPS